MNRSANLEMLTRCRMVVLLSMQPTTGRLISTKSSQIVKEKNWEVENLACEGLMAVVPRNSLEMPGFG
jgi:hypothetical protein